ncbi:hypothetical protein CC80DRAFT_107209 [Byssothecium circinans]|uniref:Uncharacterized protein n=1 Tax=Byssothecium circinans TaxID=147558 RepID=A0A6A5UFS6_9PLEO|nr:hypothetical protein CC80DRAFT_107209 [Byssothecium circinans]
MMPPVPPPPHDCPAPPPTISDIPSSPQSTTSKVTACKASLPSPTSPPPKAKTRRSKLIVVDPPVVPLETAVWAPWTAMSVHLGTSSNVWGPSTEIWAGRGEKKGGKGKGEDARASPCEADASSCDSIEGADRPRHRCPHIDGYTQVLTRALALLVHLIIMALVGVSALSSPHEFHVVVTVYGIVSLTSALDRRKGLERTGTATDPKIAR